MKVLEIWPSDNEDDIWVFMSMIVHFAVDEINEMTVSKDEHEVHREIVLSLQPQTPKLRNPGPDTQPAPLRASLEIFESYLGEDPQGKTPRARNASLGIIWTSGSHTREVLQGRPTLSLRCFRPKP